MNFFLIIIFLSLLSSSCTAKSNIYHKYTGYDISHKFKKLQNFTVEYEVENGGPVFDNEVSVYQINKNQCAIVSRIDGDSGVYGTETILYFYNAKVLKGYLINYNYTFLDGEGSDKADKVNYGKPEDKQTLAQLNKQLSIYINQMNKKTLSECN